MLDYQVLQILAFLVSMGFISILGGKACAVTAAIENHRVREFAFSFTFMLTILIVFACSYIFTQY